MSAEVKPECAPEHPLPSAFITQTPSQLHSELGTCFEPGDVVWAYVKGHPWWPAVVSEDDLGGDEERLWYQSKGNKYHVQYLGPLLEHQWITPARLVRFISKQQFDDHLKSLEKKSSAGRVCPRHKEKWDLAVEEANRFLKAADKVAMLNKKLVDAEEEREQNKENQKNVSLKVCIYDSQTYVLNEKAFKNVNKRFRDKDSSCTNKLALVCEKIEISNEDLESFEALNLNADCIFRLKIEELGEQRKTKSLSSSSEISEKVESRRARNCSESSSISSSLKSFEGTTGNFKLMLDVEIVEALKSSKWKLKQLIMKHQGKLAERLVLKMKMSPKSKEKESKLVSRKSETLSLLTLKEAVAFLGDDGKSPIKRSLDKIQRQIEKQQLKEKSMNDQTEKGPRTSRAVAVPERELKPVEIVDPLKLLYLDPNTKDKICLKCEGEGKQMISCVDCLDCYHPSCLPSEETEQIEPKEGFKCAKCKSGLKLCFSCHDSILGLQDSELFQCTVSNCRKMYHLACLDKYPALNENFGSPNKKRDKCPQHLCASCFPHDTAANKVCFVGKTIKCLKCPLAYHSGKNEELLRCVPAGSSLLSNHFLICPAHFATATGNQKQKQKFAKKLHKMHLNVHWCFLCGTGGDLVVCEMCPAAFHPHCVKLKTKPDHSEQPFYCESCMAGILPRFGDIVWVKCGNYRWWPAKIVHPEELPENIYKKNHEEGDFAVQFFGSRDFMWTSLGRVFLFEENDTASKGTNNHLSMVFQKGLKEATDAFRDLTAQRERELIERVNGTSGKIPAPYKYVTRNIPQGNVKVYKADLDNYATCTCKEDDLDPCGPSSNCENRYTMIECHPKLCKAGDRCRNQRFARAEYAETYYFKCGDRGWGLKNKTTIQTGQFVNEYCGDLITYEEYERRLKYQNDRSELDFYFCVLDSKRVIDAKPKGCHSRFMNHSCDPNCYGQLWTVNGDIRVGLFAIREIPPDSELTFNYNLSSLGIVDGTKKPCLCGAETCSGFIGEKPKAKTILSNGSETSSKTSDRKRKRKRTIRPGDRTCFRCGGSQEEGALAFCSRADCAKCYHIKCLGLAKNPGKWDCPKHFCDVCGKGSASFCQSCDNSFCKLHTDQNIVQVDGVDFKCNSCFKSKSPVKSRDDEIAPWPASGMNKENTVNSGSEVASSPFKKVKLATRNFQIKDEPESSPVNGRRSSPRKKASTENDFSTLSELKLPTENQTVQRPLSIKQENNESTS